jgi:hypothetical protein
MKMIKHVMLSLLIVFLATLVLSVSAQENNQEMSEEQKKMMELWKKYTFPGEKHKHIEYFVGEWESIIKSWPVPGKEPKVRNQKIKVESFFDGRFTKAHIKTDASDIGMVIETIVINGYDNFKQEFFSITLSKLRTDYYLTTGKLDKTGKIRTDTTVRTDILTGEQYRVKAITTIINRDKYTYEYYQIDPEGNEIKRMDITYTRKK